MAALKWAAGVMVLAPALERDADVSVFSPALEWAADVVVFPLPWLRWTLATGHMEAALEYSVHETFARSVQVRLLHTPSALCPNDWMPMPAPTRIMSLSVLS